MHVHALEFARRAAPPRRAGPRAARVAATPRLWAWVAVAVFALLPLTHAMAATGRPSAADVADVDDLPMPGALGMPARHAERARSCPTTTCRAPRSTSRSTELERTLKVPGGRAAAASQREMQQAATAMMDSGAAMSGVGAATGLLGMIPGVGGLVGGMVGSVASQAASAAAMASVRERQGHMMETTQKMVASYQAQAAARGTPRSPDRPVPRDAAASSPRSRRRSRRTGAVAAARGRAGRRGGGSAAGSPPQVASATPTAVPGAGAPPRKAPTTGRIRRAPAAAGRRSARPTRRAPAGWSGAARRPTRPCSRASARPRSPGMRAPRVPGTRRAPRGTPRTSQSIWRTNASRPPNAIGIERLHEHRRAPAFGGIGAAEARESRRERLDEQREREALVTRRPVLRAAAACPSARRTAPRDRRSARPCASCSHACGSFSPASCRRAVRPLVVRLAEMSSRIGSPLRRESRPRADWA